MGRQRLYESAVPFEPDVRNRTCRTRCANFRFGTPDSARSSLVNRITLKWPQRRRARSSFVTSALRVGMPRSGVAGTSAEDGSRASPYLDAYCGFSALVQRPRFVLQ